MNTASLTRVGLISLLLPLILVALVFAATPFPFIALYFFRQQGLPTLAVVAAFLIALRYCPSWFYSARLRQVIDRLGQWRMIWLLALAVLVIGGAGGRVVFHYFPLSIDEFWARADGTIFATGKPMVHIPAKWLPYAHALQPISAHLLAQAGTWSSGYLPINGLIQHALGVLASPLMAALSVVLVADLARRLIPGRPFAPLIAALFLVCSSQFLITAMTPYAMTAHLAFNLAWLWLYLRRGAGTQIAAMAIGFVTTGLHQFIYFPLFALPFLFETYVSGERRRAIAHALVLALGVLVWSNYDSFSAAIMGVTPPPGAARNTDQLFARMVGQILDFDLLSMGLTALNLLRFQLWQNPLAIPLAVLATPRLIRQPGPLRAGLGAIGLTGAFMMFVLPFQGLGWGYRYLHGDLGSLALLATYGWYQLSDRSASWRASIVASVAASIGIVLPLHAYQAWRQATPYVAADRALGRLDVDIVVIEAPHHANYLDLVRNSPLLDNRPKRMAGALLSDAQLMQLCKMYRVGFFTDRDAERFGIPANSARPDGQQPGRRCR